MNLRFARQVGVPRWLYRTMRWKIGARLLQRDRQMRLPTGLTLRLPFDSLFAGEVFVTRGNVDHGAEELLARFTEPRSDAFDIGANIGYYSVYLAPLARTVYAFEPDPRNIQTLRLNAEAGGDIHVVASAVSDAPRTLNLEVDGPSEISHIVRTPTARSIEVTGTTVDHFVGDHPEIRVTVIKIDVEGHDLAVLRGSETTVTRFSPLILAELADVVPGTADFRALEEFCDRHAYTLWAFAYPVRQPWRATLSRIDGQTLLEWKMLFLVPSRLHDAFESCGRSRSAAAS
jgi:FkbM family methyltransferase